MARADDNIKKILHTLDLLGIACNRLSNILLIFYIIEMTKTEQKIT